MPRQSALIAWRVTLLTSLGLTLGCGGSTTGDAPNESGGAGSGGSSGSGGGSIGGTAGVGAASGFGGATAGVGGASGFGGTSGGGGALPTGGTAGVASACQNPTAYAPLPTTEPSFVSCAGNWLHRPVVRDCPSRLPRAEAVVPPPTATVIECTYDSDCAAAPNGYCTPQQPEVFAPPIVACAYGCIGDADCPAGTLCLCGDPVGTCASAACSVDADCGDALCAGNTALLNPCSEPVWQFACQDPADECRTSDACPSGQACAGSPRRCTPTGECGRPYLIDGVPRTASATCGRGWAERCSPSAAALGTTTRHELAAHWTRMALMEHASVAAFSRFVLELLSLGAPADLVRDAQLALGDEILHAELCFGLASAYAGTPIAPGPLPLDGSLAERGLLEIAGTAFVEACIGETVATVQAEAQLDQARDPEVRRVLERIAADERRHAELGWRFVQWVLARESPEFASALRARAEAVLAEQLEATSAAPVTGVTEQDDLAAHGLPGETLRRATARAALLELCVPCAAALFAAHAAASDRSYRAEPDSVAIHCG